MHTNFSLKPCNFKSDKSRDSSFYFWLVEWHRYRSTGLWEAWLLTVAKGELITLILLCVFFLSVFQPFNSERVVTVLHRWAIMVFFSSRSLSVYTNSSFLFLFVDLDWPCSFFFHFLRFEFSQCDIWYMRFSLDYEQKVRRVEMFIPSARYPTISSSCYCSVLYYFVTQQKVQFTGIKQTKRIPWVDEFFWFLSVDGGRQSSGEDICLGYWCWWSD